MNRTEKQNQQEETSPTAPDEAHAVDEENLTEPDDRLPELRWDELPENLQKAAGKLGWTSLTPVQAKTIPYLLAGRDIMVQSRTGSGKTGAFLLPILAKLDPEKAACQALVLTPTRELAGQVAEQSEALASEGNVRTVPIYGGVGYGPQMDGLRKGAHIVVGTPGRILDHLERGTLSLDRLRFLVFDEGDRLLSMGFYPDMERIRAYLPDRRIGSMFSATFPPAVQRLAEAFLNDPGFLSLSRDGLHVRETDNYYYIVPAMEKDRCLVRIIEIENPPSAIIFCNTRANVDYVTEVLLRFGYNADRLSADLTQKEREKVLGSLRTNEVRFLVATDVAARGLDVEALSHVILYDFPEDPDSYIHRAGRTGRAGASGIVFSLVSVVEELELKRAIKQLGLPMEALPLPTEKDVNATVAERLVSLLESRLRDRDRLRVERMARMFPLVEQLAAQQESRGLLAMLLDDLYQDTIHSPVELPPPLQQGKERSTGRRPERSQGRRPEGRTRGDRSRRRGGGRGSRDRSPRSGR